MKSRRRGGRAGKDKMNLEGVVMAALNCTERNVSGTAGEASRRRLVEITCRQLRTLYSVFPTINYKTCSGEREIKSSRRPSNWTLPSHTRKPAVVLLCPETGTFAGDTPMNSPRL